VLEWSGSFRFQLRGMARSARHDILANLPSEMPPEQFFLSVHLLSPASSLKRLNEPWAMHTQKDRSNLK
jgi:hypothetical protein